MSYTERCILTKENLEIENDILNVHDDGCAFRAIRLNVWCGDFHSSDGVPFHEINDTLTYFLLCVQFSCVLQSRFYSQLYVHTKMHSTFTPPH